jgi:hypothetical protein
MVKSKFNKLHKITLVGWVEKALNQLLTKQNIKARFKGIIIWTFNLKPMDN